MPKTYTVSEVAKILGYSTNSIYTFLKEKRIKGVRFGRGRFRIPEEELARILHLSKKPAVPQVLRNPTDVLDVDLFDLFDWFIGISSVVSGVALFLFNASVSVDAMSRFIPFMRITLLCAGSGLIVSSIQGTSKRWHLFFQSVLCVVGFLGAYGMARAFDVTGAVLYASLSVIIVATMLRKISAEVSLGYFMTLLGFGTVLGMVLWPQQMTMKLLVSLVALPPATLQWILLCIVVVNTSAYWIGYIKKSPWLFAASCAFCGVVFVLTAVLYGEFLYWSRSFFFLVLAFFCFFLPVSTMLAPSRSQRQRLYLHLFFGLIGGLLLLGIMTVYALHHVLWYQRVDDFENKILVGRTVLENAIVNVKSSVTTASGNADFLTTIEKRDTDALTRNAKIVFEGNSLIRRLIFLRENGDVAAVYPYGVLERTNYAFREYFIRVRDTKVLYVSNIFESHSDQGTRPVISVVMPLLDTQNEFSGVMVASVNLEKIALQLQQLARESGGEYFTVADQNGKYVIHPNIALIGTPVPVSDPLYKKGKKQHGVENTFLSDGSIGLVAYDTIPSLGWGISVQVPSGSILALNTFSLMLTFCMISGVFVVAILLLYLMKFRWLPKQRGYP